MKHLATIAAAVLLSGCSVTAGVIGKVGPEGNTYRGVATGYMDRTGTIDMTNADGVRCVGGFRYTGAKTGVGELRCNDGRTADIQFNGITHVSGYGYGTVSDGSPISFTFGLSEEESKIYLSAPPKASARTKSQRRRAASRTSSSGTGFFINTKGHILTNEHVVEGCATLRARTIGGSGLDAQVVATDSRNDLAVITTNTHVTAFATFGRSPNYRQGDRVVVYGFPLSSALSPSGNLTTGTLTALTGVKNDTRYLQISAPVQPGNSGGPLSDTQGTVIGVVSSKLNAIKVAKITGDVPQNVNFAVKDAIAKSFLQANSIPFSERKARASLSVADVGDVLKSFVVHIECRQ